jgi:hypothetical protein
MDKICESADLSTWRRAAALGLYTVVTRRVTLSSLHDQLALAEHVIDMRQNFGEGEAHLMRIERAMEQHGHQLRRRHGRLARGGGDQFAAFMMMLGQHMRAPVQAIERQLMAGKHEHVLGNVATQAGQRTQVEPERIAVRDRRPRR